MPPALVKAAIVIGAHGIRGEIKLLTFIENTDLLGAASAVVDAAGKPIFSLRITGVLKNGIIAKPSTTNDRNAAELLKGKELFLPAEILPELDEDEFYFNELIGLRAQLENGQTYGTLTAMHNFGAGDIMEITLPNGETELLPFQEGFIGNIDEDARTIVIFLPEYIEVKED
jgi:16S rRNA processing protein RimM